LPWGMIPFIQGKIAIECTTCYYAYIKTNIQGDKNGQTYYYVHRTMGRFNF